MSRLSLWRCAFAVCSVVLLTAAYERSRSAPVMTQAAKVFLTSLTPEQAAKAKFTFADEERYNWHFIPRPRKGLPLKEMTATQQHLAHALLSAGLSQSGYIKAVTIMSLEDVLRQIEHDDGNRRNPEGYFFSIFGEPSDSGAWGYRVEGHHISLNFTLANGRVVGSPNFFGSNPAEVREGPRQGLRVLGREEDLARELMRSLNAEQKRTAIIDAKAYPDILTMASREAAIKGEVSGLASGKMTGPQRDLLMAVLHEYTGNLPEQIALAREEQIKAAGGQLFFAWAGTEEKAGPHYYRIQAPAFLVEYDNTQNNANHVHTVWRDFKGDFGGDLLKEHYAASHSSKQ